MSEKLQRLDEMVERLYYDPNAKVAPVIEQILEILKEQDTLVTAKQQQIKGLEDKLDLLREVYSEALAQLRCEVLGVRR